MEDLIKTSETILESLGISPTANRLLILKRLLCYKAPVSLAEMEADLDTVDPSTLFRTISLFEEKKLLMVINDGSKSPKYELLLQRNGEAEKEFHAHFYCTVCKACICMPSIEISDIILPAGYSIESVNFVLRGKCPHCRLSKPL